MHFPTVFTLLTASAVVSASADTSPAYQVQARNIFKFNRRQVTAPKCTDPQDKLCFTKNWDGGVDIECAPVCCHDDKGEYLGGCEAGSYCNVTGKDYICCKEGIAADQCKPATACVNAAQLVPHPNTIICPTATPLCYTERNGAAGCSGEFEDFLTLPKTPTATPTLIHTPAPNPAYPTEPPKHYPEPPKHYPEPPKDYPEPPKHYPEPPKHYPEPPKHYPEPPKDYPEPPKHYPEPPKHYPEPPKDYPEPPKHYSEPPKYYPEPPKYEPSTYVNTWTHSWPTPSSAHSYYSLPWPAPSSYVAPEHPVTPPVYEYSTPPPYPYPTSKPYTYVYTSVYTSEAVEYTVTYSSEAYQTYYPTGTGVWSGNGSAPTYTTFVPPEATGAAGRVSVGGVAAIIAAGVLGVVAL